MVDELMVPEQFPEVAIESIRRSYLFLRQKKAEVAAIRKALDRLVVGETGKGMSPEEAITFLRSRVVEARQSFVNRTKAFTPHLSTYLNQRRYLRVNIAEPLESIEDAVSILACYPNITSVDIDAHMPILRIIDEHCKYLRATHGSAAASYIRTRTIRFAECVKKWPDADMQFVPGPMKFFKERRYEQHERTWTRAAPNGFQSERDQLSSLIH